MMFLNLQDEIRLQFGTAAVVICSCELALFFKCMAIEQLRRKQNKALRKSLGLGTTGKFPGINDAFHAKAQIISFVFLGVVILTIQY